MASSDRSSRFLALSGTVTIRGVWPSGAYEVDADWVLNPNRPPMSRHRALSTSGSGGQDDQPISDCLHRNPGEFFRGVVARRPLPWSGIRCYSMGLERPGSTRL